MERLLNWYRDKTQFGYKIIVDGSLAQVETAIDSITARFAETRVMSAVMDSRTMSINKNSVSMSDIRAMIRSIPTESYLSATFFFKLTKYLYDTYFANFKSAPLFNLVQNALSTVSCDYITATYKTLDVGELDIEKLLNFLCNFMTVIANNAQETNLYIISNIVNKLHFCFVGFLMATGCKTLVLCQAGKSSMLDNVPFMHLSNFKPDVTPGTNVQIMGVGVQERTEDIQKIKGANINVQKSQSLPDTAPAVRHKSEQKRTRAEAYSAESVQAHSVENSKSKIVKENVDTPNIKIRSKVIDNAFYLLENYFKDSCYDRHIQDGTIDVPVSFNRIVGVISPIDKDYYDYVNRLLELVEVLKKNPAFQFISGGADKDLNVECAVQQVIESCKGSTNRFSTLVDWCGLVFKSEFYHTYIKNLLIEIYTKMSECASRCDIGLNITEALSYIITYINSSVIDMEFMKSRHLIFYYGDLRLEHFYYLWFLNQLGWSVVHVSADSTYDNSISSIISKDYPSITTTCENNTRANVEFPTDKLVSRTTTAYSVSGMVDKSLFNNTGLFKPYQLDGHEINHLSVRATFEETLDVLFAEARIRQNFSYTDTKVYIPNVFMKINGVKTDLDGYINSITDIERKSGEKTGTHFSYTCPDGSIYEPIKFKHPPNLRELEQCMRADGRLEEDKLLGSSLFSQFSHIKLTAQKEFVRKLNILINAPNIFNWTWTNSKRINILQKILSLKTPDIADLLHKFDYYSYIPKFIFFNSGKLHEDYALDLGIVASFMNLLGFDVLIFNPTGYADVEKTASPEQLTVHILDEFNTDCYLKTEQRRIQKNTGFLGGLGKLFK